MSDWQLSSDTVDFRNEERRAANRGPQDSFPRAPLAKRFSLAEHGVIVASFDTWEEASVAFSYGTITKMIPRGSVLFDRETNRSWLPGADCRWESAQT